jgi:hypothetical protein
LVSAADAALMPSITIMAAVDAACMSLMSIAPVRMQATTTMARCPQDMTLFSYIRNYEDSNL